jgi:hypothetical protein
MTDIAISTAPNGGEYAPGTAPRRAAETLIELLDPAQAPLPDGPPG